MAREFKLLFVLCLAVACLSATAGEALVTVPPDTTDGGPDGSLPPLPPDTTDEGPNGSSAPNTTEAGQSTPPQPPTIPSDPCISNLCGKGSICEPRAENTYVCLCLAGDFYNYEGNICESAKVFPGYLSLSKNYTDAMKDKMSKEFLDTSQEIVNALYDVFKTSTDYSGSTVLELRPSTNSKMWSRSENKVNATVEIIFKPSADITFADIDKKIENASCSECALPGASLVEKSLCSLLPCDTITSECLSGEGSYNCTCFDNYIKTDFSDRMCIACPSGQQAVDSKCVRCPFGYSGLNCNESWQLVLVVVGSVLGGLLLITLILLPIVACKSSKKSSKTKKSADTEKPHVSHSPAVAPLVNSSSATFQKPSVNGSANAFANVGMPRIPRAATNNSWDRTNLEMTPSYSRQNLVPGGRNLRLYEDQDGMAPYAQARPQINPYVQNRPQVNPYASSQGQTNSYYTHDDGRRFN